MIKYAAFLAAIAVAGSAAADGPLTAVLQSPVGSPTEATASSSVFACKGATCVAQSDTSDDDGMTMCKDLAHQFGPIAHFGSFDGGALARCNAAARH